MTQLPISQGNGCLAYTHPARLAMILSNLFRPIVETSAQEAQMEQYAISMETNPLVAIREELRLEEAGANGLGAE